MSEANSQPGLMRTLIVGIGAVGGVVATRALCAGIPVCLATRTKESAARLRTSGLRVSGVGGEGNCVPGDVWPLEEYMDREKFDLILLATKAQEAFDVSSSLLDLLSPGGTLLPIQNGAVPQILSEKLGKDNVLGGLSNLGATMTEPGVYRQTNAGHLLIGEIDGGSSQRTTEVQCLLSKAVEVRTSPDIVGAIWAKLLINCSVTTPGAVCAQTMRQYIMSDVGMQVFQRAYDEALGVAIATGIRPQRMIVEPIPPGWPQPGMHREDYSAWVSQIVSAYGDIKPSMLQDFERKRLTEIDFINGHVTRLGATLGKPVQVNRALTEMVHSIEQGRIEPGPGRLRELLLA
jgi:2-dehydropantoate 2-reductase